MSTGNIHRRFSLLFTLPSTFKIIFLIIITSFIISVISTVYDSYLELLINIIKLDLIILIITLIETTLLRNNSLASFRRLGFISIISNILWIIFSLFGYLILYEKFILFIIFGTLISVMFRFLVYRSVFSNNIYTILILSVTQPFFLTYIILDFKLFNYLLEKPILLGSGIILILSVIIILHIVELVGYKIIKISPISMFRAFLKAWTSEEANSLEEIIEELSSSGSVMTNTIIFDKETSKSILVIPEIHPGPFYPIGSSNLPFNIFEHFQKRGFSPLILHGVSGHDLNLSSRKEVDKLLLSYENLNSLSKGKTCSIPIDFRVGKALAHGIAFGDTAIIFLTLSPHGMEDFPREIIRPLEEESKLHEFKHLLLVDTHNSQGNEYYNKDSLDIIDVSKKILNKLKESEQFEFKIGFSNSLQFKKKISKDIGPAGISVILIEVNKKQFLLISVDTNNIRKGLREEIINNLKSLNINILDICTSDTHVTAGKVITNFGYVALGDDIQPEYLINIIKDLYEKALLDLGASNFQLLNVITNVKIIGSNLLNNISLTLDKLMKILKLAGISLLFISLSLLLLNMLLS